MYFSIVFVVFTTVSYSQSARILGVYPLPAYSHYKLGDVIFKELAKKGHEVTVISPYKEKNPPQNFKQILLDDLLEKSKTTKSGLFDQINFNIFQKMYWLDLTGIKFTELTLSHPKIEKFLKEKHEFDLVIYHQFMSDAYNGFCHHFKSPCIAVSSMTAPGWINRKIGNPGSPSYVPQLYVDFTSEMNLFERLYNTFVYILSEALHQFHLYPKQNQLLQTYFPNPPHLNDLYYNTSLILINSHVSINDVAPSLPNLIHIAGAHIDEPRPLSSDLRQYLDSAKEGVIFFSMGSNLNSKDFPENKRNAVLNVFSKLNQKILWKWEDENLPNKPENVKVGAWFPQPDILAHPNVVLFITHGGMMSTIEAVYHGVPVLGVPVFSDQGLNMKRAELAGYGKYVFYKELNEDNFGTALNEMLSNSSFKENAKKRSFIMKDQPIKPLENAVFWIEYVLKHRGAPHLKSAALLLSWYQYYLLDVLGCAILMILIILFTLRTAVKNILRLCCTKKDEREKKKKH